MSLEEIKEDILRNAEIIGRASNTEIREILDLGNLRKHNEMIAQAINELYQEGKIRWSADTGRMYVTWAARAKAG